MKQLDLASDLLSKTERALAELEKGVFGEERGLRVQSGLRAGAACPPGSCPRPLYGVPPE